MESTPSTTPDRGAAEHTEALGGQLAAIHHTLRTDLARLRAELAVGGPGPAGRPRELRTHCLAFCAALTRHHTTEDAGVFPALAAREPRLRPVLDELSRDHDLVTGAIRGLNHLLDELPPGPPSPGDALRVSRELDTLNALLETHFLYEEKTLRSALDGLGFASPEPIDLGGPDGPDGIGAGGAR